MRAYHVTENHRGRSAGFCEAPPTDLGVSYIGDLVVYTAPVAVYDRAMLVGDCPERAVIRWAENHACKLYALAVGG